MLRDVRQPSKCRICGASNEAARVRCMRCGATLLEPKHRMTTQRRTAREARREPATAAPAVGPPPATGDPRAWLAATVFERPHPLTGACVALIGRDRGNHVVLDVLQVSREHALIKWDGEAFVVIDRGSTNGTFVNGEQVRRRRLADGDRLGIGPFELVFRLGLEPELELKPEQETRVMSLPGSISGELTQVSVPEICQLIELNQKTGVLAFRCQESRGAVFFSKGRAIHAEFRDQVGEAAALDLLSLRVGTFRFLARESVTARTTIRRTTASLLMETARRSDEAGRSDETTAA